jgi:hypothetical protein
MLSYLLQLKKFFGLSYPKPKDSYKNRATISLSVDINGNIFTDMLIDADHDGYEYEALVGHYATLIFLINSGGISKTLCENIIKHSKDDNNCYKELIEKILEIEDSLKNISQNITPLRKPSEVFLYDK